MIDIYKLYELKVQALLMEAKRDNVRIVGWDDQSILIQDQNGYTQYSVDQDDTGDD